MVKLVNRAKMTTATTGTGTITLGAAVSGFQTFTGAGVVDGDVVRYVIEDGDAFEIGTGVFGSAGGTLTRNPSESSAGGGAITLTGNALVFVGAASADVQNDVTVTGGTINGTVIGGSTPAAISGTTGIFSGDVGIGTTPSRKLDVAGEALIRGTLFSRDSLSFSQNTPTPLFTNFIHRPAAGTLAFGTASSERLRIDSEGNVGIGTSSPAARLDVIGGGVIDSLTVGTNDITEPDPTSVLRLPAVGTAGEQRVYAELQGVFDNDSINENGGAFIKFRTSTVSGFGPEIGAIRLGGGAGDFIIKTGGSGPQERLRITNAGTLQSPGGSAFVGTVNTGSTRGAIIQRGSNANGDFVRFADGTQICYRAITMDHTNSVSGSSRLAVNWTYPATFVGTVVAQMSVPAHLANNFSGCSRLDIIVFGPSGGNASTGQAFSIFFNTGTVSTTAASVSNVQVSAQGRWF